MASPNLPDRTYPLVPNDLGPVSLKCRDCARVLPPGYPFVPVFATGGGQQEMMAVLCVYCEGSAEG